MRHIGIDLHKRSIVVCVLNEKREVVDQKKFSNEETKEMEADFRLHQPFQAVFEATAAYDWFYALLEPLAERVILAHPKKLRIIADSTNKSDQVDAKLLGTFLALEMIPEAHCPSPYIKGYRELVRLRCRIQSRLTSVKNRIRNLLSKSNQDRKGAFTKEGKAWLKHVQVQETTRYHLNQLLEEFELYEAQKKRTEEKIRAYVKTAPHRVREARELVLTIPGVGEITADVVVSEWGEIKRFPSQKAVCSYAGLVPGRRQSGEREKHLPITKNGSRWLRWILVEAAWSAVQHSPKWRRMYESLCEKTRNKKKAIVALARKLLCVMYTMIRRGCVYSVTA